MAQQQRFVRDHIEIVARIVILRFQFQQQVDNIGTLLVLPDQEHNIAGFIPPVLQCPYRIGNPFQRLLPETGGTFGFPHPHDNVPARQILFRRHPLADILIGIQKQFRVVVARPVAGGIDLRLQLRGGTQYRLLEKGIVEPDDIPRTAPVHFHIEIAPLFGRELSAQPAAQQLPVRIPETINTLFRIAHNQIVTTVRKALRH